MSTLETVLTIIIDTRYGYWNNLWLVSYSRLNLFVCPKITFLEGIFLISKSGKSLKDSNQSTTRVTAARQGARRLMQRPIVLMFALTIA